MVCDVIAYSWGVSGQAPESPAVIGMSQPVRDACNELRDFLFERVYQSRDRTADNARNVMRSLYNFYRDFPQRLPAEFRIVDDPARGVVDYIAGMTDQFATEMARSFSLL
jgi:dGTPase